MLEQIEELGEAFMSKKDVLLIVGLEQFNPEQNRAYMKGIKTTQFKLNKMVITQALQGSKPAQDITFTLLDNIQMDGY